MFEAFSISFLIVTLAEMGDKSQLVCMALAARLPPRQVLIGAILAFAGLNALAVAVGGTLASWLPTIWVLTAAAVLFAIFGLQALWQGWQEWQQGQDQPAEDTSDVSHVSRKRVIGSTFSLIAVAELGDKTQLSVAALSTKFDILSVWLGATLGLAMTSALGVLIGCALLRRLQLRWLHLASGVLFLVMALAMAIQLIA
ncbi:TMEM165/GDT1 family protein [Neiella sp. HB171785]|uniref:GDT1 family protein n=1 Tax=Neiella litorisoli TaxID=2771431 RepID=A0A8J6QNF6_9GAMM|nr:TMEM165/GDT1 family protein [Neiella litorisoli]MBD1387949.1 TMEM165/GDT1 family protein [Neiella litorisoli]